MYIKREWCQMGLRIRESYLEEDEMYQQRVIGVVT